MSKFVWVQKAKGNETLTWMGSKGRVKRLFCTRWCREATSFWETRLSESKPRKSVWTRPKETNHIYIYIYIYIWLVPWGWAKRTPINIEKPGWGKVNTGQILFGARRPRETRHILGWALKAEWNDSSVQVGAVKLREMNPTSFWETRLSESKPRSNFVWFT